MPAAEAEKKEARYNVILISFDTLRRDFVSAYGYPKRLTPTIDRLARRGVRFRDAFANCGWTLPQHVTMVTGCNPIHHRVVEIWPRQTLSPGIPTLAEVFRDNGYLCLGLGNENAYACSWQIGYTRGMRFYTTLFPHNNMLEQCVPLTIELLRAVRGKPFFLYFHTNDTHEPFAPSEPFFSKYGASYVNRYEGQVNYADHYLGLILAELRRLKLEERTLIVFTSDHGTEFEEHGFREKKLNLYDEILRVPLIMALPGVLPAGKEVSGFAQTSDLAPTLLDLCSLPVPERMDGRSLAPQIRGERRGIPKTIFAHTLHEKLYYYESFCARTERYKFIRTVPMAAEPTQIQDPYARTAERFARLKRVAQRRSGVWRELYDLRKDPGEQRNIIAQEQAVARELEAELGRWIRQYEYEPMKPWRKGQPDPGKAGFTWRSWERELVCRESAR